MFPFDSHRQRLGRVTYRHGSAGHHAIKQSADSAAGFRIGARQVFSPIFGFEVNFGYNPATQNFTGGTSIQDGVVYSHAKLFFTVDYVATAPHLYHGFQPFVLAGGGLISYNISSYIAAPPGQPALPVKAIKVPTFEYGVGADDHPNHVPQLHVHPAAISRAGGSRAGL